MLFPFVLFETETGETEMTARPHFMVIQNRNQAGFHITFGNGYTLSVQFGFGNYCERPCRRIVKREGENAIELG